MLNLTAEQKVLDVGCGIGGGDFYMAKVSQRLTYDGFIMCPLSSGPLNFLET